MKEVKSLQLPKLSNEEILEVFKSRVEYEKYGPGLKQHTIRAPTVDKMLESHPILKWIFENGGSPGLVAGAANIISARKETMHDLDPKTNERFKELKRE